MDRRLLPGAEGRALPPRPGRRGALSDETHAEAGYYARQMATRTPMVVRLTDGEELRGVIEWYDRDAIKLTRAGQPNLLIYKHCIRYLYKEPAPPRAR